MGGGGVVLCAQFEIGRKNFIRTEGPFSEVRKLNQDNCIATFITCKGSILYKQKHTGPAPDLCCSLFSFPLAARSGSCLAFLPANCWESSPRTTRRHRTATADIPSRALSFSERGLAAAAKPN